MTLVELRNKLNNLYLSQPENKAQYELREKMIAEIETRLGIRQPEHSAMVEFCEIDDAEGFSAKRR